eukprot:TRINITY_DN696_c0_g1_i9.p1 TRINITY_DN696_c0_g1~~TRINITY_DN696_c0_g1_i9.p1  ORF type:complete len:295 (+),score=56.67 TRINITY_DN696_c0_g1_i9:1209-2093(+)
MKFVYEEQRKFKDYGYEKLLARRLDDIIRDCDKLIERQDKKLKDLESEKLENDPISRQIAELQQQAEKLGEEGNVDEYMKKNAEIEQLKQKRHQQQLNIQIPTGAAGEVIQQHGTQSQQQKLRVCEVCACLLSKFDSDKRLADHFTGRTHVGYQNVRQKLEELKAAGFAPDRSDPKDDYSSKSRDNDRDRDRERDRDRRDRDRDRDRDYDRDRRDRSRRDDRDRDRRDRRYRDRDYERDRRDRDRDRDYDRDRKDRSSSSSRKDDRDRDRDRERRRSESPVHKPRRSESPKDDK